MDLQTTYILLCIGIYICIHVDPFTVKNYCKHNRGARAGEQDNEVGGRGWKTKTEGIYEQNVLQEVEDLSVCVKV